MRVAMLRLAPTAFDIFGEAYTPKAIKPHLKGLRAAGRALPWAKSAKSGRIYRESTPSPGKPAFGRPVQPGSAGFRME